MPSYFRATMAFSLFLLSTALASDEVLGEDIDRTRGVPVVVLKHQYGPNVQAREMFHPIEHEILVEPKASNVEAAVRQIRESGHTRVHGIVMVAGTLDQMRDINPAATAVLLKPNDRFPSYSESDGIVLVAVDYVTSRTWKWLEGTAALSPELDENKGIFSTILFLGREAPRHLYDLLGHGKAHGAAQSLVLDSVSQFDGMAWDSVRCTRPDDPVCETVGSVKADHLFFCTVDSVVEIPTCAPIFWSSSEYKLFRHRQALLLDEFLQAAGKDDLVEVIEDLESSEDTMQDEWFSIQSLGEGEEPFSCKSFEWFDQAQCGTCWAYTAASALSQNMCIASRGKADIMISPVGFAARARNRDLELPPLGGVSKSGPRWPAPAGHITMVGGHGYTTSQILDRIRQGSDLPGVLPHVCRPYKCRQFSPSEASADAYFNGKADESGRMSFHTWLSRDSATRAACQRDMVRVHSDASMPVVEVPLDIQSWDETTENIQNLLKEGHSMMMSVKNDQSLGSDVVDDGGIVKYQVFTTDTNHATVLVGWGKDSADSKYWLVQNTHFGMKQVLRYQRGFDLGCLRSTKSGILNLRRKKPAVAIKPSLSGARQCGMDGLYAHSFYRLYTFFRFYDHRSMSLSWREENAFDERTTALGYPQPSEETMEALEDVSQKCEALGKCKNLGEWAISETSDGDTCKCVCPEGWGGSNCETCTKDLECPRNEEMNVEVCACSCKDDNIGSSCFIEPSSLEASIHRGSSSGEYQIKFAKWNRYLSSETLGRRMSVMVIVQRGPVNEEIAAEDVTMKVGRVEIDPFLMDNQLVHSLCRMREGPFGTEIIECTPVTLAGLDSSEARVIGVVVWATTGSLPRENSSTRPEKLEQWVSVPFKMV